MHNHYIINEIVEFHPATNSLRNLNNPEVVVALNSPAGRCLLLLINRVGTVVTQHEFMDIVWKQSGMTVTPNAYYQNISVLRKGLKRIGLGDDIIITLPRIGLTLATGTQIRKLTTTKAIEINHENAQFFDVHNIAEEMVHDEHELTNVAEVSVKALPQMSMSDTVPAHRKAKINLKFIIKYILLLVICISFIAMVIANILAAEPDYFADYVAVKSINECKIMIPIKLSGRKERDMAMHYGERYTGDCDNYPWIYVTKIANLPRASIIRCDKSFEQSTICVSTYFIE